MMQRDDFIEKDRARGIFFTQDWVSMPGVIPVASTIFGATVSVNYRLCIICRKTTDIGAGQRQIALIV